MKRQNIRKLLIITAMLLFPIVLYYMSPVLIINAAFHHIMNGSFIVFCGMFILSIPFGRLFCGYFCPAAGVQECLYGVNDKVCSSKADILKYIIWGIWFTAVVVCFITNGGIAEIDPFFMTDHGISVAAVQDHIIYYGILCLIVIPCIIGGKRAFCRRICWMAPFMIIGSRIWRKAHLPGLHIAAKDGCVGCDRCSKACPMGIDVKKAAITGSIDSAECILCGNCADNCPKDILRYAMRYDNSGKRTDI